jgi:hypothetical protein
MDTKFSKKQKKEMRELQGLAWQRELEEELGTLENFFSSWRDGTLDAFELSDRIHSFHNGASRDLYTRYSGNHYWLTVPGAIAKGKIDESEVSKELLEILSDEIKHYRAGVGSAAC